MKNPLLSIIIATHKRADILKQCLEHLERQTIRDQIEVIVVSDGHDAETAALFPRVDSGQWTVENKWKIPLKFFEIEKCQQGVARNSGVQEAGGEYVLFIGDDIFLAGDACERHLKVHRACHGEPVEPWHAVSSIRRAQDDTAVLGHTTWDPQVGITPVMRWLEKTGWQFGYPMIKQFAHAMIPRSIQHRFTYTSHISLPTNVARSHPFLVTDLYGWEDIEWGKRLAETGVQFFYEPDALAWHHHRLTMEDSLGRMETLGQSVRRMAERDPAFDRMPRGWKLWAYRALSILPTMRGKHAKAFLRGLVAPK